MADTSTITVASTTTITTTKVLTRTLLNSVGAFAHPTSRLLQAAQIDASTRHVKLLSLYPYRPSLPLAIIFTILYFLTTLHHGYLSLYLPTRSENHNKHRYTIPLFVASLLSTIGYLSRSVSIQKRNVSNLPLYTTSTALIIVSPILVCATLYLLLTRLITRCLPSTTAPTPTTTTPPRSEFPIRAPTNPQRFVFLPPTLLSALFIAFDALSFLLQCTGASVAASHNWTNGPQVSRGTSTLLAGLAIQLATFLLYLAVLHLFCLRVRNSATHGFNPCIMQVVTATWVASGFVVLRTLFRLVEFAMGSNGYPFLHEWCLYVFEAFPVWVALVVLGRWHPIKWIQERVLSQAQELGTRGKAGQVGETITSDTPGAQGVVARKPVAGTGNGEESHGGEGHVRRRSRAGFAL